MNYSLSSLESLPDEILLAILFDIPPRDVLLAVQRASIRLRLISNERLLWREYCRTTFKYWDPKHQIVRKFRGVVGAVDWKDLFRHRFVVDLKTSAALDGILSEQIKRIEKFDQISTFGYDAKDSLLRHSRTGDDAEDCLARRFYSNSVLDHIHRCKALEEWANLGRGNVVTLERALGAFDMFILHDQVGDLSEISELFDDLVRDLRASTSRFEIMSPRNKALIIAEFLRKKDLTGIESDLQYYDLQNNYVGIALQDEKHPSLPLISVAIFCVVAQRVGLDAKCCGFPNHVHAMVYPGPFETLDGIPRSEAECPEPMFLDPYRSSTEVPVDHLLTQLRAYGVPSSEFSHFLGHSTTRSVVLRTSRNILAVVREFGDRETRTERIRHPRIQLHGNQFADMDNAFYSALWANFMLFNISSTAQPDQRLQLVRLILSKFERLYPMDASLLERYLIPTSTRSASADDWGLRDTLRVVKAGDAMPKQMRRRDTPASVNNVKYKVGQLFKHRRFDYHAVIVGWDVECSMNLEWIERNDVDLLARGRHQSFYHVLSNSVEDAGIRYVAEENIIVVGSPHHTSLMDLAGRYFKRWDVVKEVFISNIKDEYPDD